MKLTKSLLSIAMALIIFITNTVFVNASEEIDMSDAFELAEEFLTEYYYAIDQGRDYDYSKYTSSLYFLEYINTQIESQAYAKKIYDVPEKLNYSVNVEFIDLKDLGNCIMLETLSHVRFQYITSDYQSGYGETNYFLIANGSNGLEIKDWYITSNPYCEQVRGTLGNEDPTLWEKQKIASGILNEQVMWREDITYSYGRYVQEMFGFEITSEEDTDDMQPTSIDASPDYLDKNKIVTWALNNCSKKTPTTGDSSQVSTYYDFSTISGNYDCTNFASHALLAGGATMNTSSTSGDTAWYYKSLSDRTSSWSGVDKFYSFLTHNKSTGPAGTEVSYTTSSSRNFEKGDIIQLKESTTGTTWTHTTIITGFDRSGNALVTGRSKYTTDNVNNKGYNYNDAVSDLQKTYKGGTRVIKLNGEYK